MFTLKKVELEYETNISRWDILNDDRTLMTVLILFPLAARLNSQNPYVNQIHI